jgi:hypothetical protein
MPKPEMHMSSAGTEFTAQWQQVAMFSDPMSAHVVAELLRSEDVPVDVLSEEALSGLLHGTCLRVPPYLMHRARWLLEQPRFADEELAFLATGRLGDE